MKKRFVLLCIILLYISVLAVANADTNGWVKEESHLVYYKNGTKVTGTQTIDGNVYYFTNDGFLKGNGTVQNANYNKYYIKNDNTIATGWQKVDGDTYYFYPETGIAAEYSYSDSGPSVAIEGIKYAFDSDGKLMNNRWYYNMYGDKDGHPLTGYQTIEDKRYLFSDTGNVQTGFHEIDGKPHYFYNEWSSNCYEAHGWAKINNSIYYFDPETGVMQTSQRTIDGTTYQFNEDGTLKHSSSVVLKFQNGAWIGYSSTNEILSGWNTINGEKYYFNNSGQAYIGNHEISDENGTYFFYYFDSNGKMETGWKKHKSYDWEEQESWFYYGSDGKRVYGFQTIEGSTYYFEPNYGYMATGVWSIGEERYFFGTDGKMITGWQKHKRYSEDKKEYWYYYGIDGKRLNGFQKVNEYTFYLDNEYGMYTGLLHFWNDDYTVEDFYFFDSNGRMQIGWVDTDEGRFYFGADGKRLTGWQYIDGIWYYLDHTPQTGTQTIYDGNGNSSYYFFDENGKMQTGWQKHKRYSDDEEEHWFYYDADGKGLFGWQTINNETYYIDYSIGAYQNGVYELEKDDKISFYQFDEDGKMVGKRISIYTTGWVENGAGIWQYGDKNGCALVGIQTVDGVLYFFNDQGNMLTGWIESGGKWYYAAPNGSLSHNTWMNVGDSWYYFLENGEMAVGWVAIGGTKYHMSAAGAMETGWVKDGDNWYYFVNSGAMYTGWLLNGGTWYLLKPDGAMATGFIKDGSVQYYFDQSGAMKTGWIQNNGNWYYFGASGAMQTGWLQDGGSWYYLNSDGAMATGWVKDGGTWYYMSSSGAMATGWQKISGNWYYLEGSGAMKTGWFKDTDGTWYWFDGDGVMVTGTQTIDGKEEVFSSGGAWMYTVQ